MKIIDKRTEKKEYTFKDLVCGNVFEYSGDIYLKLDTSGEDNNAYNLNTCKFATLSDDAVMPIETELVIRDTKKSQDSEILIKHFNFNHGSKYWRKLPDLSFRLLPPLLP